jgi:hypothetical protein
MQCLNGSYTSYFNRRHRRSGHLLEGRFKAHLVEEEGYFLEISRYIHLNPVRAKIVDRPEAYRWSSYRGYMRAAWALEWVTYARVLGEFGRDAATARREYARFVRAGIDEPPPSPLAGALGGLLVGSERFVAKMRGLLRERPDDRAVPQLAPLKPRPSLATIREVASVHFGCDANVWQPGRRVDDAGRAVAAYLARRRFGYRAGEIAEWLGYRSPSSVTRAVARVETGNPRLQQAAAKLEQELA